MQQIYEKENSISYNYYQVYIIIPILIYFIDEIDAMLSSSSGLDMILIKIINKIY